MRHSRIGARTYVGFALLSVALVSVCETSFAAPGATAPALATAAPAAPAAAKGVSEKDMADALHAVIAADRFVYTKLVVNRLSEEEKVIKASEHWEDDKALPLPAQMLRAASDRLEGSGAKFTYALTSLFPINKKNTPASPAEKKGLEVVAANPAQNYYGEDLLGTQKYFLAVYPDVASSEACASCHNNHPDSPRKDWKLNDVMGAVVVRIPVQ